MLVGGYILALSPTRSTSSISSPKKQRQDRSLEEREEVPLRPFSEKPPTSCALSVGCHGHTTNSPATPRVSRQVPSGAFYKAAPLFVTPFSSQRNQNVNVRNVIRPPQSSAAPGNKLTADAARTGFEAVFP